MGIKTANKSQGKRFIMMFYQKRQKFTTPIPLPNYFPKPLDRQTKTPIILAILAI
jgi:hypothetical protein